MEAVKEMKSLARTKTIMLYHGSPNKVVTPTFGLGKDNHDYGRGFYLTSDKELAKEWAWCRDNQTDGWVHTYMLDCSGLRIFDFEQISENRAIYWITELLKHRLPDLDGLNSGDPTEYRAYLYKEFDANCDGYDVVRGWRADDSYFKVAKAVLQDRLQIQLLEEALRLGDLGIQLCCRSAKAYEHLMSCGQVEFVPQHYAKRYQVRDLAGREAFDRLLNSNANKFTLQAVYLRNLVINYLEQGGTL